ncbi:MAG TPA: 30S ribosome-binding factor RbfA [Patescibacteria group bacterium]|nr:30S ribosome-binding factor RbfA [Patescibacteria group bacterium]
MSSTRIEQVNELIQQELGKIILENIEFEPGVLVTITHVSTSDTLENATVWISIFPEGKTGSSLETLNKEIGHLQKFLNRKLFLKFVPKIAFKVDTSEVYASEIEEVFKKIEE